MPVDPAGHFSPTEAACAVRSIERLIAQRRFGEAITLAGRSLLFEPGRRDVALLEVRALIGAERFGEAADRALVLVSVDTNDSASRTLLRTAIGRLHRSVRAVLLRAETIRREPPPLPVHDDALTERHEPFGPFEDNELRDPPRESSPPRGHDFRTFPLSSQRRVEVSALARAKTVPNCPVPRAVGGGDGTGRKARPMLDELEPTADDEPLFGEMR